MSDLYRVTSEVTSTYINGTATYRHYFDLAGGTPANAVAAVQALWTALVAVMNGTTNVTINPQVEQMNDADGVISNAYSTGGGTATSGTAQNNLAWSTCMLLQWRTGAYYTSAPGKGARELRGRMYVPCMTHGGSTGGKPSTSLVTAGAAAAAGMVSHSSSEFRIWRRPVRDASGAITRDGESAPATAGTCWTNFAVHRSFRD